MNKKKKKELKIKIRLILHFCHKKPPNQVFSYLPFSLQHPQTPTHSTTPPPPILLVSLDMLPSPLPTLFSAPLHFGHSYIYGVIRRGSPFGASRITAHTELWRAGGEEWGRGGGAGLQTGEWKVGRIRESLTEG